MMWRFTRIGRSSQCSFHRHYGRQAPSTPRMASPCGRGTSPLRVWRSTPHSSELELVTWVCFANGASPHSYGARLAWWKVGFVPQPTFHHVAFQMSAGSSWSLNGLRPKTTPIHLHLSQAGGLFMVFFRFKGDLLGELKKRAILLYFLSKSYNKSEQKSK